jgi:hypothetical protein
VHSNAASLALGSGRIGHPDLSKSAGIGIQIAALWFLDELDLQVAKR